MQWTPSDPRDTYHEKAEITRTFVVENGQLQLTEQQQQQSVGGEADPLELSRLIPVNAFPQMMETQAHLPIVDYSAVGLGFPAAPYPMPMAIPFIPGMMPDVSPMMQMAFEDQQRLAAMMGGSFVFVPSGLDMQQMFTSNTQSMYPLHGMALTLRDEIVLEIGMLIAGDHVNGLPANRNIGAMGVTMIIVIGVGKRPDGITMMIAEMSEEYAPIEGAGRVYGESKPPVELPIETLGDPPDLEESKMSTRIICCRDIPAKIPPFELKNIFSKLGLVASIDLTYLKSHRAAFVKYYILSEAQNAKKILHGKNICAVDIKACFTKPKGMDLPCTGKHEQGTLVFKKKTGIFSPLDVYDLERKLKVYGRIIKQSGEGNVQIFEFDDYRHCAVAHHAFAGDPELEVSFGWDGTEPNDYLSPIREENEEKFFVDAKGDPRLAARSKPPTVHSPAIPPPPSILALPLVKEGQTVEEDQVTSSPHLLAQMSSLLSSLQKNSSAKSKGNEDHQEDLKKASEKAISGTVNAPALLSSSGPPSLSGGVRSTGGVVRQNRLKKEPTIESVQELARILLEQTKR